MQLICPHCGYSKTVCSGQIPAQTSRVTCPRCRQCFILPQAKEEAAGQPSGQLRDPEDQPAENRLPQALPKAGFWIRVVATMVDTLLVFLLQLILGALLAFCGNLLLSSGAENTLQLTLLVQLFTYVLSATYYVFFTGYCGQTPGKMALRIKVIRCNGAAIGFGRAALREIPAKFVSAILLGIGFVMVAFDDHKQGLHDRMADTYVIKL